MPCGGYVASEAEVIRYRSRVSSHPWGRSSYDPEARWASWQRARLFDDQRAVPLDG
jgi:hypothetical protein